MEQSGGLLLPPVQTLVATDVFAHQCKNAVNLQRVTKEEYPFGYSSFFAFRWQKRGEQKEKI